MIDPQVARGGDDDVAGQAGVITAELDEVAGTVEVEAARTAEGAVEDERARRRADVDHVARDRADDAGAGPGARTAAEAVQVGAVVERERGRDRADAPRAEGGAGVDGGRDGADDIGVLEADRAAADHEIEVGDATAEIDLVAADLGQRVGLAGRRADRAVGLGALDAADIEAAAVAAEGGVRGEREVVDADRGVRAGGVGVTEGGVDGGAVAGAGQDDVEAAGAVIGVAVVGVVDVQRGAGQDGDRGAATEGGVRAEDEAAGLDGDAAGVVTVALDGEDAGADLA